MDADKENWKLVNRSGCVFWEILLLLISLQPLRAGSFHPTCKGGNCVDTVCVRTNKGKDSLVSNCQSVLIDTVSGIEQKTVKEKVSDSIRRERRRNSGALFYVDVKSTRPVKDNFFTKMFRGHVDRTFEKAIDYSIVLVPSFSREGSLGLGGMGAALYRLDRTDSLMQPSDISLSANASIRGFFYLGILGNTYFPGRRHRLNYELSFSQKRLSFWGINYDSCQVRPAIDYTRWKAVANVYYDYELLKDFYLGAAVNFSYTSAFKIDDISYLDGQDPWYITTGIGFSMQYDSRDYIGNPTDGFNVFLRPMVYPSFLGTDGRTLWRVTFQADYYQKLWRGAVLGVDLFAEINSRDMPWALREEAGGLYRLRGYYAGRYVDNNLISAQVELRQKVFWRVGLAAFVGVGSLFPSFEDWRPAYVLPSVGIGLRFEFKHNVNLRIDYGFGKGTNGFVICLGESF